MHPDTCQKYFTFDKTEKLLQMANDWEWKVLFFCRRPMFKILSGYIHHSLNLYFKIKGM